MNREYRQMMQRYAQEAPESPFSEEEIDRVTAQPRKPDGSGVPIKRWSLVAVAALLVSVGAGMLWPREEEGVLVAENTLSRDGACPVSPATRETIEPVMTSQPQVRKAPVIVHSEMIPEMEESIAVEDTSTVGRGRPRLYTEPEMQMPASHPAEHIICYHDGVPVECEDEQTINIIMSFLS